MDDILTAFIGMGLFYLGLHPEYVRQRAMFVNAIVSFVVTILVTLVVVLNDDGPTVGIVIKTLASVTSVIFIFLAIDQPPKITRRASARTTMDTDGEFDEQ